MDTVQSAPVDDAVPRSDHGAGIGGLPEPKSIAYQLEPPRQLVEHVPGELTCSTVTANERDALLVWSPDRALPSDLVEPCEHLFRTAELYAEDGRPLYFAVVLSAPEP